MARPRALLTRARWKRAKDRTGVSRRASGGSPIPATGTSATPASTVAVSSSAATPVAAFSDSSPAETSPCFSARRILVTGSVCPFDAAETVGPAPPRWVAISHLCGGLAPMAAAEPCLEAGSRHSSDGSLRDRFPGKTDRPRHLRPARRARRPPPPARHHLRAFGRRIARPSRIPGPPPGADGVESCEVRRRCRGPRRCRPAGTPGNRRPPRTTRRARRCAARRG